MEWASPEHECGTTPGPGEVVAQSRTQQMIQYVVRRLLQMIPITLGILTLIFSLIHMIPGDPAAQIAGEGARPADIAAVRKALGLDQPLLTQYGHYLAGIAHGDLGTSFRTNEKVSKEILQRGSVQMKLGAAGA